MPGEGAGIRGHPRASAGIRGICATALVLAAGAALPATREAFRDSRYHLGWGDALLTALVLIPVGTVLVEETAFRGVLWALLRRRFGTGRFGTSVATATSSALFGLWHVLPSLGLAADNEAITTTVGRGRSAQALTVIGTVLFTAASGVIFCELRRREGPAKPRWWTFPRTRRFLARFRTPGLTGALSCYCLSLTPSLLPRAWFLQAVMSGITTAIGYGIGAVIGWLARSLIGWTPGRVPRLVARWALAAAAVVLIPLDRKVLVVATTTGTGWINPAMLDPLEYMYDGDTATVAIQYSYLPSWISFVVDKATAQDAGRDLFDAVYDKWHQLPAGHRPELVVLGESLGSFGGEAAFSGTEDIRDRALGVLWVGPTNSNTLWSRFTSERDPGSPEWRPVYQDGRTVRFGDSPADFNPASPGWERPRVVYLQNPSDPIVWWSWQLAFHQPDWLRGTHPPDVSSAMHWYPLVTFWQVAADLALATAVPPGHGHTYGMLQGAAAWAAIIPPPGWTGARTAELGELPAN